MELALIYVLDSGGDLSGLIPLQGSLEHLHVQGLSESGDEAAGVLAQLTHLKTLVWTDITGMSYVGDLQLTALQRLTKLMLHGTIGTRHHCHNLDSVPVSAAATAADGIISSALIKLLVMCGW